MATSYLAHGPASILLDTATNAVLTVVCGDMSKAPTETGQVWVYINAPTIAVGIGDVQQSDGTYATPAMPILDATVSAVGVTATVAMGRS